MADIYRQSYLTISATWADSPYGGLFIKPEAMRVGPVMFRKTPALPSLESWTTNLKLQSIADEFPLFLRGWAIQERMLAPRIVHFCRQEIVFDCGEHSVCEGVTSALTHSLSPKQDFSKF